MGRISPGNKPNETAGNGSTTKLPNLLGDRGIGLPGWEIARANCSYHKPIRQKCQFGLARQGGCGILITKPFEVSRIIVARNFKEQGSKRVGRFKAEGRMIL
jgi:hypothetical protein